MTETEVFVVKLFVSTTWSELILVQTDGELRCVVAEPRTSGRCGNYCDDSRCDTGSLTILHTPQTARPPGSGVVRLERE